MGKRTGSVTLKDLFKKGYMWEGGPIMSDPKEGTDLKNAMIRECSSLHGGDRCLGIQVADDFVSELFVNDSELRGHLKEMALDEFWEVVRPNVHWAAKGKGINGGVLEFFTDALAQAVHRANKALILCPSNLKAPQAITRWLKYLEENDPDRMPGEDNVLDEDEMDPFGSDDDDEIPYHLLTKKSLDADEEEDEADKDEDDDNASATTTTQAGKRAYESDEDEDEDEGEDEEVAGMKRQKTSTGYYRSTLPEREEVLLAHKMRHLDLDTEEEKEQRVADQMAHMEF